MFDKNECKDYKKPGDTRVQWIMVFIASTTMISYGLEMGWISPMSKILQSEQSPTGQPLSDEELTWIGSILSFAAVFGVSFYAFIADMYGRKASVLALAIPQLVGWIIKLVAINTPMLIIGRVISGLPAGGCFNVLPMYIREISQDDIRGTAVSVVMMMQTLGIFFMYLMGSYLSYSVIAWIAISVSSVGLMAMYFLLESPAYLIKKEKIHEATKIIALLRGLELEDKTVQCEVHALTVDELHYKKIPKITIRTIFKNKAWRRGSVYAMLIVTAQACNGNLAIVTYAWTIMSSMGVALNPDLQTLVVPIVMIIGSLVAVVGVERLGRKLLAVATYWLTTAAMTCLGTVLLLQTTGFSSPAWVSMISIATIVFSYSAGITPAFYVVLSEIFNFQVRAKLVGCIVSYAWFVTAVQILVFAPLTQLVGMHTMFYIFAVINLLGGVGTLVLLPETKGKTIEEIEKILSS